MAQPTLLPGSVTEVCYVTHDMEAIASKWSRYADAGPFFVMPHPVMKMRASSGEIDGVIMAALGFSGTTLIEFIQPGPRTPAIFRDVLAAKGEGAVHHIMSNIRPITPLDFDDLCRDYERAGLQKVLAFDVPQQGRNCFFDARNHMGVYLEVLEVPPAAYDMMCLFHQAHLQRRGQRPLQSLSDLAA